MEIAHQAKLIATYVRNQLENLHHGITDAQMKDINIAVRNATYTVLHALKTRDSPSCRMLAFTALSIPFYQEEPELTEEFKELVASMEDEEEYDDFEDEEEYDDFEDEEEEEVYEEDIDEAELVAELNKQQDFVVEFKRTSLEGG